MRKNNKMTLQDRLTIKQMYYEGKSFREIGYKCQYKFVLFVKNKNVQLFN